MLKSKYLAGRLGSSEDKVLLYIFCKENYRTKLGTLTKKFRHLEFMDKDENSQKQNDARNFCHLSDIKFSLQKIIYQI